MRTEDCSPALQLRGCACLHRIRMLSIDSALAIPPSHNLLPHPCSMPSSLSIPDSTVCQDLDDHVLQYMALVDEHLAACNRISARFQEGRELISQAKYIMGPRNVSADCYDLRMKALRGVTVDGPTDIALRDLVAEQKRAAKEAEEAGQNAQVSNEGTTGLNDEEQGGRSGLRRRGGPTSGVSSGASSVIFNDGDGAALVDESRYKTRGADAEIAKAMTTAAAIDPTIPSMGTAATTTTAAAAPKKKERNRDPLLWFGVFVPAPLRNAQSVFQKGLQDVVEMAVIRQRLLELEETIKTLQQAKDKSTQQAMPDLATLSLAGASGQDLQ